MPLSKWVSLLLPNLGTIIISGGGNSSVMMIQNMCPRDGICFLQVTILCVTHDFFMGYESSGHGQEIVLALRPSRISFGGKFNQSINSTLIRIIDIGFAGDRVRTTRLGRGGGCFLAERSAAALALKKGTELRVHRDAEHLGALSS